MNVAKDMEKLEFDKFFKNESINKNNDEDDISTKKKRRKEPVILEYMLSMQMMSMTVEKIEALEKEIESINSKINELLSRMSDLWLFDLERFKHIIEIASARIIVV